MQETTNYGFKKPELADSPPDITVTNQNWDIIDEELNDHAEQINDLDALVGLGGIAKSGENANGRYVRFKDGTQLAEMHVSFDTTSTNEQNYAVPASFGGVTSVAACGILGSSRVGAFDNSLAAISALNKVGGRCQQGTLSLRISDASTITNLGIGIMLLGRWK